MPSLRARAKAACQIARVDPDRFNEAVAAGNYPCAPSTDPGAPRLFDVNDIVVLCIYGNLLDEGTIPSKAGPQACGLNQLLQEHPDVERVICVKDSFRSFSWFRLEDFDRDDPFAPAWGDRPDVVSFREWRLHYMRKRIEFELNRMHAAVGQ